MSGKDVVDHPRRLDTRQPHVEPLMLHGEPVVMDPQLIQHGRVKVEARGPNANELRHELTFFPAPERKQVGVKEILVYYPPTEDEDRFDDCVISLAQAKWGQVHAWDNADPLGGDLSGFAEGNVTLDQGDGWGAVPNTGYSF